MTNVGLPSTQVFHSVGNVDSYLCTADGSIHAPFTSLVAYDTRATADVTGGPDRPCSPGQVHGLMDEFTAWTERKTDWRTGGG